MNDEWLNIKVIDVGRNTLKCDLLRRFVSLFILSTFLLFLLCGSSGSSVQSNHDAQFTTTGSIYDDRDHYTSYDELGTILQGFETQYHQFVKLYNNRGTTYEGRTIWTVKISDNPQINEDDEVEVLFVGAHHGNELIANEMAIFIIETITEGYGKDPRITWLVDTHEIWVVPMLNPDGTEYTLNTEGWRKNRSPNYISEVTPGPLDPKIYPTSYGTDLNRNYDMEWGDPEGSSAYLQRSSTYAGSEPFSELETRAMRDLVLEHNFSVYMDYHSGIEMILYPWGYTSNPTPDNAVFERVAEQMSSMTGYEARQGYDLYQTNGDAIDWIYSVSQALAFTVELSEEYRPEPSTLLPILENNVKLPLYLTGISANLELGSRIQITHDHIGNQTDEAPSQIVARVKGIPKISALEVKLYYSVNNGNYEIIPMKNSAEYQNIYSAEIPILAPDSVVQYFIVVEGEGILVSSPDLAHQFKLYIKPSSESYATTSELVAMIIMMIIIMGFFWGGFLYTSRIAMRAEQRKLHEYYFEEIEETRTGRIGEISGY